MQIYIVIIIILIICCYFDSKKNDVLYFLCCLFLLAVACFRDASVGIDHEGYIYSSLHKGVRDETKASIEIVWGCIIKLIGFFKSGPFFTVVSSLLTMVPLMFFIKKESNLRILSLLIFVLIPYGYCFYLTGIRQSLAVSIVIWAYYYLAQKNYKKALLISAAAVGIHASAFFVLLVGPIYFINIKKWVLYLLLLSSALIGFILINNIFDLFGGMFNYVSFLSFYEESYSNYFIDNTMNLNGLISVIVPPTVFAAVSIMYCNKNDFYTKVYCIGVIGTNLFANMPMIGRYFMYFSVLQTILVPNIFKDTPLLIKAVLLLTLTYMLLYFFMFIPEATGIDKYRMFF